MAGSVGPYGAFRRRLGVSRRLSAQRGRVQAFHRPRVEALLDAGADLLACETLPSFAEIQALAALLQEYPRARAWYSFTLRDAEHLSDGTPLREVMAALADNPQVVAVGINCIALENTPAALAHLHSLTALPLVVYPNSGEHYDAVSKTPGTIMAKPAPAWRIICRSGWRPGEADRRLLPHHAEGHRRA